jgi:hypothetical protein
MRPSSVEPFSPDPSALHPMLQKALDNLDVQLEDELIRYRQHRYRQLGERTRVQAWVNDSRRSPELRQAPIAPPLDYAPDYPPDYPPSYAPDYAESYPLDLDVWDSEETHYPAQAQPSNLSNFDARRVVREMRKPEFAHDYFASSEELLNSFPHPQVATIKRQSSLLDTLLTPLGVGSMLLLLLSTASLGYVIMHPASFGLLMALGRDRGEDSATAPLPNGDQSLSPNLASDEFVDVNLNTLSQLPKSDRPSTVVTVPKTTTPTLLPGSPRSTEPSPGATTEAPRLSAAVTEPPIQTVTIPSRPIVRQSEPAPAAPVPTPTYIPPAPETVYVAPAPQPASTAPRPASSPVAYAPPPAPIAQAPPSARRYYVVTDYTGDPSLSKARQAIGDAYVRNFDDGAKVQMGAFEDSASAEQMARQLQQQGVPAQVYQP